MPCFGFFFSEQPTLLNLEDVKQSNIKHFQIFHQLMLEKGHYFAPSPFEAGFLSLAHTPEHIEHTLEDVNQVMPALR